MEQIAYSYIRFSTKEQKKGTSFKRQVEATEQYCKEKGYKLDKKLTFYDLGLSAFNGKNRTNGELGQFLEMVRNNKVPKNSVLIIENLDRLSREEVDDAYDLFRSIIRAGITIVTLQDRMEYSKESMKANWTQLIISITYMAKAYRESKDKSDRLRSTWKIKRKRISENNKLTSKAPLWLIPKRKKISETRYITTGFVRNEKACHTIECIFNMKKDGIYNERIAQELNQMDEETVWKPPYNKKRKSEGWRGSYISKILKNREAIGEFTVYEKIDGRRVSIKTIPDYFPHAISEKLFYKVQKLIKSNAEIKGNSGGMTGKAKNLFKNVVKCGLCGKPMHYIDKGPLPKGGIYLHCDSSRRKVKTINCIAKPIRYEEFERLFFDSFDKETQEILSKILHTNDQRAIRINQIEDEISANNINIKKLEDNITELTEHIMKRAAPKTKEIYENANRKMVYDIELLKDKNKNLGIESQLLKEQGEELKKNRDRIKEIYTLLNSLTDEQELIDTRHKLNLEIMKMFEWIKIYPLQEPYQKYKEIEPGILQIMDSKFIDKITYKLRGVELPKWFGGKGFKSHGVILLKNHVDIGDESLESLIEKM